MPQKSPEVSGPVVQEKSPPTSSNINLASTKRYGIYDREKKNKELAAIADELYYKILRETDNPNGPIQQSTCSKKHCPLCTAFLLSTAVTECHSDFGSDCAQPCKLGFSPHLSKAALDYLAKLHRRPHATLEFRSRPTGDGYFPSFLDSSYCEELLSEPDRISGKTRRVISMAKDLQLTSKEYAARCGKTSKIVTDLEDSDSDCAGVAGVPIVVKRGASTSSSYGRKRTKKLKTPKD